MKTITTLKGLKKQALMINEKKLIELTDDELFVYIAIKTMLHGRSFKASIENASEQMKNPLKARIIFIL